MWQNNMTLITCWTNSNTSNDDELIKTPTMQWTSKLKNNTSNATTSTTTNNDKPWTTLVMLWTNNNTSNVLTNSNINISNTTNNTPTMWQNINNMKEQHKKATKRTTRDQHKWLMWGKKILIVIKSNQPQMGFNTLGHHLGFLLRIGLNFKLT
jgi:hypothetical protein